jgi:hypothetical protein
MRLVPKPRGTDADALVLLERQTVVRHKPDVRLVPTNPTSYDGGVLRRDIPLRQDGFLRRLVAPLLHQMSVIEGFAWASVPQYTLTTIAVDRVLGAESVEAPAAKSRAGG